MSFISNWLTQIILIIMFAIILELLLPNDNFQKYVKMVVGLIIIIALLNPIMKLLNVDVDHIIASISQAGHRQDPLKNSIKMKKSEIEQTQAAYIHKQVAVQMKNYAKGALVDRYGLTIKDLKLKLDEKTNLNQNNNLDQNNIPIQHVDVVVGQANKQQQNQDSKSQIKPIREINVTIDQTQKEHQQITARESQKEKKVTAFLASKWGINPSKITVHMEGGDG
ncbi:stage III sporulation protein AF [Scopulibacillus daqui]|uniref:Stage III sporulation protein AF n=1 Tax=Scopulibacillus daqui TaxID=1469162 RepID=A0ABS2Q4A9_9BACL|nr:stage III sporulation protein AF [Scopulibacillus daqui]